MSPLAGQMELTEPDDLQTTEGAEGAEETEEERRTRRLTEIYAVFNYSGAGSLCMIHQYMIHHDTSIYDTS